ncbi:MAG: PBS lyase [Deltaproteobacteria bacterium RIFOXYD12_FULL_57_12]|nr:MAG: PBS lyase [Deltaproteobacteria bacterium RIFOXYD12_FULL_57_12]
MEFQDKDLLQVIGDFLEKGYADSIAAMFRQDSSLYRLTGELVRDERFMVRMGVAVLFEELVATRPDEVEGAIAFLVPLLADTRPWVRGEAANILGIIGTGKARAHMEQLLKDPDPQVREIAADFLTAD